VWMVNHRKGRGQAAKLQPKFVVPYVVIEAMPNHKYKLERSGQFSVQNEARLNPYWASPGAAGSAPQLLEPRRQTATRGRRRHGPEYEVVMPRAEDLEGPEGLPPFQETRPPTSQQPNSHNGSVTTTSGIRSTSGSAKPPLGEAPSGDNRSEGEAMVERRPETPPAESNSPHTSHHIAVLEFTFLSIS